MERGSSAFLSLECHPYAVEMKPSWAMFKGVRTDPTNQVEENALARAVENGVFAGVEIAVRYARGGRLISAIKYIETANPMISRELAKAVVNSFGYGHELRWPEEVNRPVRCL
jgi:hypothetical protein